MSRAPLKPYETALRPPSSPSPQGRVFHLYYKGSYCLSYLPCGARTPLPTSTNGGRQHKEPGPQSTTLKCLESRALEAVGQMGKRPFNARYHPQMEEDEGEEPLGVVVLVDLSRACS